MVADLFEGLRPFLRRPYVLFGHSLGAIVVFELLRAIRAAGLDPPCRAFLSGRIAPQLRDPRPPLHGLPRERLVPRLRELGGLPAGPEPAGFPDQLLETIRADLEANETYGYRPGPPLTVPLTVFGGTDDPKAGPSELRAWNVQTTADFRLTLLPGGHFYLVDRRELFLEHLRRELREIS